MFCQKCRTPLKVDASLEDLSPTALRLLIEASSASAQDDDKLNGTSRPLYTDAEKARYDKASKGATSPTFRRDTRASKDNDPKMSYIMLSQSQAGQALQQTQQRGDKRDKPIRRRISSTPATENDGTPAYGMEAAARLFDTLSSRSDIDHPICVECTEMLTEGMEKRLANATRERDSYAEFLKNARANLPTDEERQETEAELKALQAKEVAAFEELETLEAEKAELEEELAGLGIEARGLDREEEAFWRERNEFSRVLAEFQDHRDSLNLRYEHDAHQLERLQRTNVYNDTFNISHDKDGFATINGLRLGRKSSKTVEWPEVNAAWGQALLLLVVVAEKVKYTFKGYKLRPMGSTSKIDKIEAVSASQRDGKPVTISLDLCFTSELPVTFGFMHRHFDAAIVAFLECLRQLAVHLENVTAGTEHPKKFPHVIKKDRINDVSIKLGSFSGDDNWARACKLVLSGCKWCLACASSADFART